MHKPRLSIITPSYNQSDAILDTIKSIKKQEYPNVEHIVVDGGSDDGTVDILKEQENEYDLRWVSEPDRGQSHAVNKGIEMADGDWIGWQNSDDYYVDGAFDTFAQVVADHPDADVVYGDLIVVDRDGTEIDRAYHTRPSKFVQRYSNIMANQATFFKKSVFETVGLLKEEYHYCMDIDLFWRLTHSNLTLVHVPEFLACFRMYDEAKTGGNKHQRHLQERREIQEMYGVPIYEQVTPHALLRVLALLIKAVYLLGDGQTEAFQQQLNQFKITDTPVRI